MSVTTQPNAPICRWVNRKTNQPCKLKSSWHHLETGRTFCPNHYALLATITSPTRWVNLQRRDAAEAIKSWTDRHPVPDICDHSSKASLAPLAFSRT